VLESDEIPHAKVEISVLGKKHRVVADEEGLFSLELRGPLPIGDHPVGGRLLESRRPQRTLAGRLQVVAAAPKSGAVPLAVVSDIDDTVLDSQVTSKRKLIWRVLTSNARKLKTFKGAPALFRQFRARGYPIVFVSGSPINLYTRLQRFFALRGFPAAPLLLKNIGSDKLTDQEGYKLRRLELVRRLLAG
jgi:phosphatidate phosphatase APP1